MQEIQYVGEHLWAGHLGHFGVVLAFVASLLAATSYFFATQKRQSAEYKSWLRMGKVSFGLHSLATLGSIGLIFYLMVQQYYEYEYVWAHVSEELPLKYIASAFWEGQEGSFLLWMFWHVILGLVIMWKAGKWEAPVLSVVSMVQFFIASMLLGVYLNPEFKIGSSPFMLLRETMEAPIFATADYLAQIQGNGLNPLLQNYWMTIHPPTLFLGFASVTIPFAYAIGGLWTGEHKAWLRPALPWSLFSGAILGTGILMGGAWAYEALSFGGYWAWDPVENMSLVPWLIGIAGIHTHLVARATGHSIRSTYIYYALAFVLILYSTFLTRSGVLGDTSVHAFTEMGLEWQLILFILFFLLGSTLLIGWRYPTIPKPQAEEHSGSREFWMFIGTLVLLFSSILITASTSLPVFNKIMSVFDPEYIGRVITDPVPHYNKYQIWIAVFICFLSAIAQYLRYRERDFKGYARKLGIHLTGSLAVAALVSVLTATALELYAWQYGVLLFAGVYTVVANLDHFVTYLRGNPKLVSSHMAHMGFGIMIVGILFSGLNQRVISSNPFVMDGLIEGAEDQTMARNILLFKNAPIMMQDYEVTYVQDTFNKLTRTYTVNYKRRNEQGQVTEEFNLHPNVLYDKGFDKIAASNPSTKHYWDRDIFTHIASLPQVEIDINKKKEREARLDFKEIMLPTDGTPIEFESEVPLEDKDTTLIRTYKLQFLGLNRQPTHPDYEPKPGDMAIGLRLAISRHDRKDLVMEAEPVLVLRGLYIYNFPVQVNSMSSRLRLNESILRSFFVPDSELEYREYKLKQAESFEIDGLTITFDRFNKKPSHPGYVPEEDDIAVGADITVTDTDGQTYTTQPLYFIRGETPYNLKSQIDELGLHLRFKSIDPTLEQLELMVAQRKLLGSEVPVEIATNSLRSDYIVLEAIEFPGINLFWIGSCMMMLGMFIGMGYRMSQKAGSA